MGKRRFSDSLTVQIDALIRRVAFEKRRAREPDARQQYAERGLQNNEIVTAAQREAEVILRGHHSAMVANYLSTRIPLVLPSQGKDERREFIALLPGLNLPSWFAVPQDEESKGPFGWKFQSDVTPNQLDRIIDHSQKDIDGRLVAKNKLVLLRETALELGCDPDDPVSSVLDGEPDDPPSPDEHPHP